MTQLKILYLFFYLAFGSSLNFFSNYFNLLGLSGKTSGFIFAFGTFLAMITQPILGFIADKTRKNITILLNLFILFITSLLVLFFFSRTHLLFLGFSIYSIAIWGIMPLLDGLVLNAHYEFGKIRLYGSLGFALGVFATGQFTPLMGNKSFMIIAILFAFFGIVTLFFQEKKVVPNHDKANFKDIKLLFHNLRFKSFLFFSIFVIGGNAVYNTFSSLYFSKIGGSSEMLGFSMMIMTLTEIPFMYFSDKIIHKLGTKKGLILSGFFFTLRWYLYFLIPFPVFIRNSFILQGLTAGMFFPIAASHTKSIVSKKVVATATTVFMAAGTFGGTILQGVSGKIIDSLGVIYLMLFISITTFFALLIFILTDKKGEKNG